MPPAAGAMAVSGPLHGNPARALLCCAQEPMCTGGAFAPMTRKGIKLMSDKAIYGEKTDFSISVMDDAYSTLKKVEPVLYPKKAAEAVKSLPKK
jgi:hypothetical protein